MGSGLNLYFCLLNITVLTIPRFTISYLSFALVLAGISLALHAIFPEILLALPKFWPLFIFVAGITYIAYIVADLGMKMKPEVGVMAIMASIAVKMLFSMAFVLIYSIKTGEKGLVFVGNFFSLYLLFSFFEIYTLLRNLRHQNK